MWARASEIGDFFTGYYGQDWLMMGNYGLNWVELTIISHATQ